MNTHYSTYIRIFGSVFRTIHQLPYILVSHIIISSVAFKGHLKPSLLPLFFSLISYFLFYPRTLHSFFKMSIFQRVYLTLPEASASTSCPLFLDILLLIFAVITSLRIPLSFRARFAHFIISLRIKALIFWILIY